MGKTYNEGKAQLDVIASGLLDNFGDGEDTKVVISNGVGRLLFDYMEQTIEDIRASIIEKDVKASGNLLGSLKPPGGLDPDANGFYNLKFKMADYWEDVENGQPKGTVVSVRDLMDWIANKPIKIRTSRRQSKQSVMAKSKSVATAMSKTIYKKGTIKRFGYKGSKFLSSVINDDNLRDLSRLVAELTGLTVAYSVKSVFERENQ
jgi:hypothetical protein